jgi:aspartyl protease family protein
VASSHHQPPGKNLGQGMLIASFSLGLLALTLLFDGWLDEQSNPNRGPATAQNGSGARLVELQRSRQGHYLSAGEINGVAVTFLLDTGATDVTVPAKLARQAGLEPGTASRAATANGVVTVYSTRINKLVLGNISLTDIRASITPSMGGDTILLGMSALREIEFSQRGSTLTLRQLPGN